MLKNPRVAIQRNRKISPFSPCSLKGNGIETLEEISKNSWLSRTAADKLLFLAESICEK